MNTVVPSDHSSLFFSQFSSVVHVICEIRYPEAGLSFHLRPYQCAAGQTVSHSGQICLYITQYDTLVFHLTIRHPWLMLNFDQAPSLPPSLEYPSLTLHTILKGFDYFWLSRFTPTFNSTLALSFAWAILSRWFLILILLYKFTPFQLCGPSELHGALGPFKCSFYSRTWSHDCPWGCADTGMVGNALNPWIRKEKTEQSC